MPLKDKEERRRWAREYQKRGGGKITPARRRSIRHHRCGLSDQAALDLLLAGCPICGCEFEKYPHMDHDHTVCNKDNHVCKKCFRGFLCNICNPSFISAIEHRPSLRSLVSQKVLDYIDKLRKGCVAGSPPAACDAV